MCGCVYAVLYVQIKIINKLFDCTIEINYTVFSVVVVVGYNDIFIFILTVYDHIVINDNDKLAYISETHRTILLTRQS